MAQIPVIDFSGFRGSDGNTAKKKAVVDQIRDSCLHNGFFQVVNHGVSIDRQQSIIECAKTFFNMPLEDKNRVSKDNNTWYRGYEVLQSQILEEGTHPDLKEGFYVGPDIPENHPDFINGKFNVGPNQWPDFMTQQNLTAFKSGILEYYDSVMALASDLMRALALSLDLDEDHFSRFMNGALATIKLLHYPVQPKDADEQLTKGIGAHTDFGAITILLQHVVDGLQVWDRGTETWISVEPIQGALVVNLGNLMARWTNERYKSNVHRVINKSGRERYSVPFFLSGNTDYMVECLPTCKTEDVPAKFAPATVEHIVSESYAKSYDRVQLYKQGIQQT